MTCPICGESFEPRTSWQKYCSAECRRRGYRLGNAEKIRANSRRYYWRHRAEALLRVKRYAVFGKREAVMK